MKQVILVLLALGAGALAGVIYARRGPDPSEGWNLKPVVVIGRDLPAGSVITVDVLLQRQIPELFVTRSMVTPATVSKVIGKKSTIPLRKGDPLRSTYFEPCPCGDSDRPAETGAGAEDPGAKVGARTKGEAQAQ